MANYRERLLTDSPTGPSFSTARRKRSHDLSHVRETLNPGVPGRPWRTSFDAGGQWLVCRADASPTEDPCKSGERNRKRYVHPTPTYRLPRDCVNTEAEIMKVI